jgi:hypothetical protein
MLFTGLLLPGLSPRRFKQQRRRRLILFCIQFVCFSISIWSADSAEQTALNQHSHLWPKSILPTHQDNAIELDEQHKLRRHRSAFDDSSHRALRRKEVPVNYRLYDDLLRNYNKAARPVRHPSQIVNVTMSAFLYQIFKLVS